MFSYSVDRMATEADLNRQKGTFKIDLAMFQI